MSRSMSAWREAEQGEKARRSTQHEQGQEGAIQGKHRCPGSARRLQPAEVGAAWSDEGGDKRAIAHGHPTRRCRCLGGPASICNALSRCLQTAPSSSPSFSSCAAAVRWRDGPGETHRWQRARERTAPPLHSPHTRRPRIRYAVVTLPTATCQRTSHSQRAKESARIPVHAGANDSGKRDGERKNHQDNADEDTPECCCRLRG